MLTRAINKAGSTDAVKVALALEGLEQKELFGVTNLTMMRHLARCAHEERIVAADGTDAYVPNVQRLTFPITLLHGAYNLVWLPKSTEVTESWLRESLGSAANVKRVVLPSHGHQDSFMGAAVAEDAFPEVLGHLEWAGA